MAKRKPSRLLVSLPNRTDPPGAISIRSNEEGVFEEVDLTDKERIFLDQLTSAFVYRIMRKVAKAAFKLALKAKKRR